MGMLSWLMALCCQRTEAALRISNITPVIEIYCELANRNIDHDSGEVTFYSDLFLLGWQTWQEREGQFEYNPDVPVICLQYGFPLK